MAAECKQIFKNFHVFASVWYLFLESRFGPRLHYRVDLSVSIIIHTKLAMLSQKNSSEYRLGQCAVVW